MQALDRRREMDPENTEFDFETSEGTADNKGRSPSEIIVVCVDTSGSMQEEAFDISGLPRRHHTEAKFERVRKSGISANDQRSR